MTNDFLLTVQTLSEYVDSLDLNEEARFLVLFGRDPNQGYLGFPMLSVVYLTHFRQRYSDLSLQVLPLIEIVGFRGLQ